MKERNLMVLALLGVIIGASGLGFGTYSIMQIQTGALDGDDGDDGDDGVDWQALSEVHYCSSQSEIVNAINKIGTGHGTIIITKNITLSSTISIDDGGHYIIRSEGPVTLNRNANAETFLVTNVQSLTIKDLIIDASDITSTTISGIEINEANNNPVYLQNIKICGDSEGRGIYVNSENVWIQNCIIKSFRFGIYIDDYSAYCHIFDNSILEMNPSSGSAYGIYSTESEYNMISGNLIHDIDVTGTYSVCGILLSKSYYSNTVTGNIIKSISSAGGIVYGISLASSRHIAATGNTLYDLNGATEYGIYVDGRYNAVVGNVLYSAGIIVVSIPTENEVYHNYVN